MFCGVHLPALIGQGSKEGACSDVFCKDGRLSAVSLRFGHVSGGGGFHGPDGTQTHQNGEYIGGRLGEIDPCYAEQLREGQDKGDKEQPLPDQGQEQPITGGPNGLIG